MAMIMIARLKFSPCSDGMQGGQDDRRPANAQRGHDDGMRRGETHHDNAIVIGPVMCQLENTTQTSST